MKISLKACRFFSILLSVMLFFNLFVSNYFNKYKPVFAFFLIGYWLLFRLFVKPKENNSLCKKDVLLWLIVFAIFFLLILYGMGIFSEIKISEGFYKNPINYVLNPMCAWIFPHLIIIIYSELIRTLVLAKNDKKSTMWITVALILSDIVVSINIYNYSSIKGILEIIGCLIIPSISLNLLCNYISKRYGSGPNIIFKIITIIIYNYFMPILSDIYPIFESLIKLVYPFIIYLVIDSLFETDEEDSLNKIINMLENI